jgi:hypothetical protein
MPIASWLLIGVAFGIVFLTIARTQKQNENSILATGLLLAALIYLVFGCLPDTSASSPYPVSILLFTAKHSSLASLTG